MLVYATPLLGGILIGFAAVILLLFLGRIAGISGIVWDAVSGQADNAWRWMFVVGLLLGPLLFHSVTDASFPQGSPLPVWQAIIAGLLVGFGVKMGSGCTSGHGVCGIGRLSLRSVIATGTFMATGIFTVYITRHVLGGM